MNRYNPRDLEIRDVERKIDHDLVAHTHSVIFARELSTQEQQRFARLLTSFYDVVYFSERFQNGLLREPDVTFVVPNQARYTLYHADMAGNWKDLLFEMLASFSHTIVRILQHDGSRAFDPEHQPA